MGPGLDRIISRNHFIADWQNAKLFPSLMCQFTMTPDEGSSDGSAWTLPQTPVVWHATVVKSFMPSSIEEESGMVTLHVGEELTVYGCNPCDTTGIDPSARLVIETAEGVMGLAPANLYYYDSENDWGKVSCDSPPSNATGKATFSLTGATRLSPEAQASGDVVMGSQIAVDTAVPFEYYDFEIIQRLSPIKSPLRPVGDIFRSIFFEYAFE